MRNKIFSKGFTLIELLVVIAVIGILAGGIVSIINPMAQIQKANDSRRKSDLKQIQNALEGYYGDKGRYPTTSEPLSETLQSSLVPSYVSTLPTDPSSSRTYAYYSNGQTYYLFASLENANDPQACNPGSQDISSACASANSPLACKGICNYGVSSPDVSVVEPASQSVIPVSIARRPPCPQYGQFGDVNGDGWVSLVDRDTVNDYAVNYRTKTPSSTELLNGDVGKYGRLTSTDAFLISKYVSNPPQLDTFPAVCVAP